MRLFVGFPVAVGVEPQFTEVTLEGSFLGVSSDVRLQVSNLFELSVAFVIRTDDNLWGKSYLLIFEFKADILDLIVNVGRMLARRCNATNLYLSTVD